ncbi:MAG: hypothetical protein ACQEXJ_17405 [Myxococcota bacterium]
MRRWFGGLAILAVTLAAAPGCDDGGDGAGDYDGTCFDCATVCVACDAEHEATCQAECAAAQGYSDGFMALEARLSDWGCEDDKTAWEPADCEAVSGE